VPLFGAIAAEGVTAAIRETVQAVAALTNSILETVTLGELAKHLGLDKSTISRRVTAAEAAGYLINEETRVGRPARLRSGDPLPEEASPLPTPDAVRAAMPDTAVQDRKSTRLN